MKHGNLILPVLLSACLVLAGCSQQVSLAKFAPTIAPLAAAFETELPSLLQTKVINQETFDKLIALHIKDKGQLLGDYLQSISAINSANKDEVLQKIDDGIKLFDPLTGLAPQGSKAASILAAITTGLNLYRTAIAIIKPPEASFSVASDGKSSGISTSEVKAVWPKLDKTAQAALEEASKKK